MGEASGHECDHAPEDEGVGVVGQAFVVADGAAALADPGKGAFDDPPAGQGVKPFCPGGRHDVDGDAEGGLCPVGEWAVVAAVGPDVADAVVGLAQALEQGPAGGPVLALAAVTSTTSSSPMVSTAMWRLRPATFLPAS